MGLDVHARSVVAGLIDTQTGELRMTRPPHRTKELVGWLGDLEGPVQVAYEAGPTGFGLARACAAAGIGCLVAAPSLIARPPAGRARKSDASDAEQLARLLRAGELTAVRVPDERDEAARDLVRAREDARADLMRARHRLSKLLLRHGLVFESGPRLDGPPRGWLRAQHLAHPGARAAFEDYYGAIIHTRLRRDELDRRICELAATARFAPVVGRLECLRGGGTLTATPDGSWSRPPGQRPEVAARAELAGQRLPALAPPGGPPRPALDRAGDGGGA